MSQHFWSRVSIGSQVECWEWLGSINERGYGRYWPNTKGSVAAHRRAYELHVGPIPDGLVIDHLCRNHGCVNPSHLEAVTPRENTLRGIGLSATNARKTECGQGHPLSGDNLRFDKHGYRVCRTCERARWKRKGERRRAKTLAARGGNP